MAKKILSIALALIMALSVFAVAASAADVVNTTAATFVNDVKNADDGATVVLTEDIALTSLASISFSTAKSVTIDLAGYAITSTYSRYALYFSNAKTNVTIIDSVGGGSVSHDKVSVNVQSGATLTIEGGTFNGEISLIGPIWGTYPAIVINGGTFNAGSTGSSVHASKGSYTTINDGTFTGDVFVENIGANVTINGGTFTSDAYCIVTNGTQTGMTITVNGGTFTATDEDGAAAYLPAGGTYTFNGGTFEGADALYIKAGTTTINGGTFVGNGEAKEYSYVNGAFNPTGDAIVIDSCGYPNGQPPFVRINDGEFTSDNADALGVYTYGQSTPATVFVYGGEFSDDSAEGFGAPAAVNTTTGVYYDTVADAATAAADGDTIALMNDTDIASYEQIRADVTIDLAGYGMTSAGNGGLDIYSDVTIKDTVGGGFITANKNAVWVNPGASLVVDGGTFNGIVRIDAEDKEAATTATINGGTFNGDIMPVFGGSVIINDAEVNGSVYPYGNGTATINDGTFTAIDYAVTTQGNDTDPGTIVTINGGTFRGLTKDKKDGVAVFWPSAGTLVINAGSFTGSDAVYIKSGNVEINGGTFSAVGVKADYVHTGNGFNTTGDTIVVESCGYPGGDPSLTINGGTFASKNGEIIGYYVYGDHDLADTGFIVDGTFGKQVPSIYYADPTAFTLFNVKGGKATVDGDTVTITADEGSDKIEVSKRATNGSDIVVETVSDGVKVSKSGTLYSSVDGTASVTVPNAGTYTVVFDFAEPEVPFVEMLRTTNAEVEVNGTTIVLTPINAEKSTALTNKLADNKTTITFSNLENALVSKYGSLYSNVYGRATAEINGDEYTVIFNYEVPEPPEVALEDNLRVTNATVTVNENVITLTPVVLSKQVSLVPKTLDGKVIEVLTTETKVSKYDTLYTTEAATATVEIDGTPYTVVFDFPLPEAPAVEELLKVKGAQDISVSGDSISIIASEGTKVTVDQLLTDGTKATYVKKDGGAKVSKYGTLYATTAGTAEATIGGTTYTIHFTFAEVI